MAKLKGKAKAAFLRRMAAGRAKARRRTRRGSGGTVRVKKAKRARKYVVTVRRRNPYAVIANPSRSVIAAYRRARASGMSAYGAFKAAKTSRKRKRRKGPSTMAKKRRKSTRKKGRARRARRRIATLRPSRRTRYVYVNPRRRRRRRRGGAHGRRIRRFRRRNPGRAGIMASVKAVFVPFAAGFVASAAAAALDGALAKYPTGKRLAKVGAAVLIAMFGRRHPRASAAAIGALAATEGYSMGSKLMGGMGAAQTPKQAIEGLAAMSETYPEMGALLNGGVGALIEGVPNTGESVVDYESALANFAGDDD